MDRNYGGVVWTNHALQRLRERNIKQGDAWATFQRPDQSRYASTKGAWIYYKTYGSEKVEVVAKQNDKKEWIILTVWSRPVYEKAGRHHKSENWIMKLVKSILFPKR
jgi:Domain of unknown function (DUF4258)